MDINKCWYKNVCTNKCTESCIRYNVMCSLMSHSNLPEYLWEYKPLSCKNSLGNDSDALAFQKLKEIELNVDEFVDNGKNLYIYSKYCGNGKTSWAVRLMTKYFDKIWNFAGFTCHGLFVNVPKFLYNCKQSISKDVDGFEELCQNIENCEIVIWDDLPCAEFTSYEHQIILQYIDNRINSGKANIFTGNCNKEKCYEVLGDRLASRIFGCSQTIEFVETDKRGLQLND